MAATVDLRTRADSIASDVETVVRRPSARVETTMDARRDDLRAKYFSAQQRLYFLRMLNVQPAHDDIQRTLHATRNGAHEALARLAHAMRQKEDECARVGTTTDNLNLLHATVLDALANIDSKQQTLIQKKQALDEATEKLQSWKEKSLADKEESIQQHNEMIAKLKEDIANARSRVQSGHVQSEELKKTVDELLHQQVQIEMEMADVEEAFDRRQENIQGLRDWYKKATEIMSTMFAIRVLYKEPGMVIDYTMPDAKSTIQVVVTMNKSSGTIESAQVVDAGYDISQVVTDAQKNNNVGFLVRKLQWRLIDCWLRENGAANNLISPKSQFPLVEFIEKVTNAPLNAGWKGRAFLLRGSDVC